MQDVHGQSLNDDHPARVENSKVWAAAVTQGSCEDLNVATKLSSEEMEQIAHVSPFIAPWTRVFIPSNVSNSWKKVDGINSDVGSIAATVITKNGETHIS